ncbi:C40 family peptidase [Corynebacterium lubricantis]|uniref:C40 family peptidase n=1 Tax=Corynebacterium lubricantis TaxID=541095 RepID=UPI000367F850|nr:C40 family peptidase [Corynebacterium lubricantis]
MGQHRRLNKKTARNIAAVSAVALSTTLLVPTAANAAQVTVPGTNLSSEVPGIENIAGIANIPGIEQWIPSLAGQSDNSNVQAAISQVRQIPGAAAVPGFTEWLNGVEAQVAPATYEAAATAPAARASVPAPAPVAQQSSGQQIVNIARSKIGSPYVYGAAGPNSFDCSGFTSWVYAQAGKSIPRTSQAQASAGQTIPRSQIQPGDIIVYYGGASHVGIYAGNGTMIDALNSGSPVAERPIDYMPIHSIVRF